LSSGPEAPAAEAEEAAPELDEARQPLADALRDLAVDTVVSGGDVWVRVAPEHWHEAVAACKNKLGMDYFCFLSGIDWMDNPTLSGEKVWGALPEGEEEAAPAAPGTGVGGGETRFQVFCPLYSLKSKLGITLKADLDDDDPRVQSLVDLYRGADWHEREAWEMFGFQFDGHPGLRHIYLPSEFEGHPLRKDFPLLARMVKPWPGIVDVEPMPAGDEGEEEAGA